MTAEKTPSLSPPVPRLRQVAGWREWIELPDLGVEAVKAKLDTGARTSALHAVRMHTEERNGGEWVSFVLHPHQRTTAGSLELCVPILEWRHITSSNGERQQRPVIITTIAFFGQSWPIELTLTNRDNMGFRMLLGREALRNRLMVDSGRSYIGGRPPASQRVRPGGGRKKRKKKRPARSRTSGSGGTGGSTPTSS